MSSLSWMSAITTPASCALAAYIIYKSKPGSSLYSYHPTLMAAGWLALTPIAIDTLRASKKATSKEDKSKLVATHATLSSAVFVATVGGLYAIGRNKEINAAAKGQVAQHLVSRHGKLGAVCAALMAGAVAIGIFKSVTRGKSLSEPDYLWRNRFHRFLGAASYLVSGVAILQMVQSPWGKNNLGGPAGQKAVAAGIVAVQALTVTPLVF